MLHVNCKSMSGIPGYSVPLFHVRFPGMLEVAEGKGCQGQGVPLLTAIQIKIKGNLPTYNVI